MLAHLTYHCCSEWNHFGNHEPCSYHLPKEDVQQHYDQVDSFNASQEVWKRLNGILTPEGYTSNETFNEAVKIARSLREAGLQVLEGEERRIFEEETQCIGVLDEPGV